MARIADETTICGYVMNSNIHCPVCSTLNPDRNDPLKKETICIGPPTKRMFISTGGKSSHYGRWVRVIVDYKGKEWPA
jgi:hypothetical protein